MKGRINGNKSVKKERRSLLSDAYMADLLLHLEGKNAITSRELFEVHSYYKKMQELVAKLETYGLVERIETKRGGHNSIMFSLTPAGREAAKKLKDFNDFANWTRTVSSDALDFIDCD
jgi:predicted transcriptional regulator